MAFQQGLSGLNVSSKALDVISNNIANASTVGFKGGQAQFANVFAASLGIGGGSQVGIGATLPVVQQQFSQGNISNSNNPLDIAVNGDGFFRMQKNATDQTVTYTRNGQFHLDDQGYMINAQGNNLTGYPVVNGLTNRASLVPIQLDTTGVVPRATGSTDSNPGVMTQINFDDRDLKSLTSATPNNLSPWSANTTFPPNNLNTFNYSTSVTVYDQKGNDHALSMYFTRVDNSEGNTPGKNLWETHYVLDNQDITDSVVAGTNLGATGVPTLEFSANGSVVKTDFATTAGIAYTQSISATTSTTPLTSSPDPNITLTDVTGTIAYTYGVDYTIDTGGQLVSTTSGALSGGGMATIAQINGTTVATNVLFAGGGTVGDIDIVPATTVLSPTPTPQLTLTNNATTPATAYVAGVDYTYNAATRQISFLDGPTNHLLVGPEVMVTVDYYTNGAAKTQSFLAPVGSPLAFAPDTGTVAPLPPTPDTLTVANATNGTIYTSPTDYFYSTTTGKLVFPVGSAIVSGTSLTVSYNTAPTAMASDFEFKIDINALASNPLYGTQFANLFPNDIPINFDNSTLFGTGYDVNKLVQDGYAYGRLSGVTVGTTGLLTGNYSNGQTKQIAQLVLANFVSPTGLVNLGNNQWQATAASGQALIGDPGTGIRGVLQAAAVEDANVDLTQELVNLITQQRNYQANAQSIKTQDQVMQTLVNLR